MESSHNPDPAHHQVYLLTLWRETPNAPWRAALRKAGSQGRIGFADLEALALFLLRLDEGSEHPVGGMDGAMQLHAPNQASQEIDKGMPNDTMTRCSAHLVIVSSCYEILQPCVMANYKQEIRT